MNHGRSSGKRVIVLPPLDGRRETEERLREVFRAAIRQALAPGLALGLFACSQQPLSVTKGGVDAMFAHDAVGLDLVVPSRDAAIVLPDGGRPERAADLLHEPDRSPDRPATPDAMVADRLGQDAVTASCVGGWGVSTTTTCESTVYAVIDPRSATEVALYDECVRIVQAGGQCPTTLCLMVRTREPSPMGFGLHSCGPACKDGTQRGVVYRTLNCAIGRRPADFAAAGGSRAATALGDYFARAAELEAASIPAFECLERELAAHGAPGHLIEQASRARADEVRHTAIVGALAARFGGRPRMPSVPAGPVRSLEDVAVENAVEGCVRETFGALVASWQAGASTDPVVAVAMAGIAEDETRHASLAWQVDAWARRKLSPESCRRVDGARREAAAALAREQDSGAPPRGLCEVAGLPRPQASADLFGSLRRQIWDRRAA